MSAQPVTDSDIQTFVLNFYAATSADVTYYPGTQSVNISGLQGYFDPNASIDWSDNPGVGSIYSGSNQASGSSSVLDFLRNRQPVYRTGLAFSRNDNGDGSITVDVTGWTPANPASPFSAVMRSDYAIQQGDAPFAEKFLLMPSHGTFFITRLVRRGQTTVVASSELFADWPGMGVTTPPSSTDTTSSTDTSSATASAPAAPVTSKDKIDRFVHDFYQALSATFQHPAAGGYSTGATLSDGTIARVQGAVAASDESWSALQIYYTDSVQRGPGNYPADSPSFWSYSDQSDGTVSLQVNGSCPTPDGSAGSFTDALILVSNADSFKVKSQKNSAQQYI